MLKQTVLSEEFSNSPKRFALFYTNMSLPLFDYLIISGIGFELDKGGAV